MLSNNIYKFYKYC